MSSVITAAEEIEFEMQTNETVIETGGNVDYREVNLNNYELYYRQCKDGGLRHIRRGNRRHRRINTGWKCRLRLRDI